ncbi:MAG: hypothetical protein AB1791_05230 [Chloroflexota bacterium]
MTLTASDIYQLLQDGDAILAFDTSVTNRRGFVKLCEQANRVNEWRQLLGLSPRLKLCIPAAAHTESLFHLGQKPDLQYNANIPRRMLRKNNVSILLFEEKDAEHCAELLARLYPTEQAWQAYKRRRCLECTGLPTKYHKWASGKGEKCGAPNDWLIIAQAERAGALLVMDDKGRSGDEYSLLERKVSFSEIRTVLQQIWAELDAQLARREEAL